MNHEFDFVETYLQSRIRDPKTYRGMHLSQHNRLPREKLDVILTSIFDTVGAESFIEPSGDDPLPSRSHKVGDSWRFPPGNCAEDCRDYWTILDRIAGSGVKGVSASFNSLKKNLFPNLQSMGLLERIQTDREGPKRARLTDTAISYLSADKRNRIKLFADASERPLKPLIERLDPLLERFNVINVMEIMLFVSDGSLGREDLESLIWSYKKLRQIEKLELHEAIQLQMSKSMGSHVPKTRKLDWHNWLNQAQQMIDHLKVVTGFSVYQEELVMRAGDAVAALFAPQRSQTVKLEALKWHSLERRDGWELHHILPIDYATSQTELAKIDSKENLIYISQSAHRQFPRRANRIVKVTFQNDLLRVFNPASRDGKPEVNLRQGVDVLFDPTNASAMVRYNEYLLEFIG